MAKLIRTITNRPRPARRWFSVGRKSPEQEFADLIQRLNNQLAHSPYCNRKMRRYLARKLDFDVLGMKPLPPEVRAAFSACVAELIELSFAHIYREPGSEVGGDLKSQLEAQVRYRQQLAAIENEAQLVAQLLDTLKTSLAPLGDAISLPKQESGLLQLPMPLTAVMTNPVGVIHDLTQRLTTLAPDPTANVIAHGDPLGRRALQNVLAASKLTLEEAQKRPMRMVWPAASNLAGDELVDTYLSRTPLASLLKSKVNLPLPKRFFVEMLMILATIGWGKSQLLQQLALLQIDDPDRPGVVVIDSQGDVIRTLSRLKQFDPAIDDRLVIIDPSDAEHPLAFNLFHVDRDTLNRLSPSDREEFLAGIIELFNYVAGALLGAELTAKMQVVFQFLSQWLIQIPDATIHTLLQLLTDPSPYLHYVQELPQTAQLFIHDHLLVERSQYKETCQQIARRLFHVLSNPTFDRIFSHPTNKFNIGDALNSGRVVLVNTAKGHLKAEWSAIFGRFIIAQIMQATFARSIVPDHERRTAYIHVDEASEYLDRTTDQILIQGRKYEISLALYFQTMQQATDAGLRSTLLSIPAARFVGGVSDADATLLAKEMNTTPEFLKAARKHKSATEWSVFVRGLTPTAVRYSVPFLQAERAPKMSPEAHRRLMARIHAEVAEVPSQEPPPTRRPSPTDNNGDEY